MEPDNKEYTFEYKEDFSVFTTLLNEGSYPVMGQLALFMYWKTTNFYVSIFSCAVLAKQM